MADNIRLVTAGQGLYITPMEYWVICASEHWNSDPREGEAIGIVQIPNDDGYDSWGIYHELRPHPETGAWADEITQVDYETYEAFDFPVFVYGTIDDNVGFAGSDRVVYDPRYWKIFDGTMVKL